MRESTFTTNHGGSSTRTTSLSEVAGGSEIARITKTVEAGGGVGRMRFRATYWNAMSISGSAIEKGTVVRPVNRVGNTWYVAAAEQVPAEHVA